MQSRTYVLSLTIDGIPYERPSLEAHASRPPSATEDWTLTAGYVEVEDFNWDRSLGSCP
ncbi:MAG: hypothetical protein QOE30_4942 [Mycobacterium sp.]|jgi:hypothetical protein|nr:hypothetical protein [Mycobacterium sp.]